MALVINELTTYPAIRLSKNIFTRMDMSYFSHQREISEQLAMLAEIKLFRYYVLVIKEVLYLAVFWKHISPHRTVGQ